jgi:hypothetical protein
MALLLEKLTRTVEGKIIMAIKALTLALVLVTIISGTSAARKYW